VDRQRDASLRLTLHVDPECHGPLANGWVEGEHAAHHGWIDLLEHPRTDIGPEIEIDHRASVHIRVNCPQPHPFVLFTTCLDGPISSDDLSPAGRA